MLGSKYNNNASTFNKEVYIVIGSLFMMMIDDDDARVGKRRHPISTRSTLEDNLNEALEDLLLCEDGEHKEQLAEEIDQVSKAIGKKKSRH